MFGLVLIILGVIAVAPFIIERRKADMNQTIRDLAPNEFAKLSDGHTHYKWHGPPDGPVLVCVHGLTTPSFVWDAMMPELVDAGYRVLTYDLFGRGMSDRPKGTQTRSFFMRQLRDLLQHEGVQNGFTLMGYSMGGSIVTVFAAEEPARVGHLVLLAPAGMEHVPSRLSEFARKVPWLGDWVMLTFGGLELRKIARNAPASDSIRERMAEEPDWRGYLPAVLSSQRNLLAETLEEEHRAIHKSGVPVTAIWGELDTVIPLSAMGKLVEWNRDAHQATIPDADHALGMSHPVEVVKAMTDLIAKRG